MLLLPPPLRGGVSCSNDLEVLDENTTLSVSEDIPIQFSTYLGQPKETTRAGYSGAIDKTSTLQSQGFGLFADFVNSTDNNIQHDDYLYGWDASGKYADSKAGDSQGTLSSSMMENAKVLYKDGSWGLYPKFETGKDEKKAVYWPNPSKKYDGTVVPKYVSFFAYAPYVDKPTVESEKEEYGIKAIAHAGDFLSEKSEDSSNPYKLPTEDALREGIQKISWKAKDPIIYYSAARAKNEKYPVDLLWGTGGDNSPKYDGTVNQTATTVSDKALDGSDLTGNGPVNLDLQKMKASGTVSFKFKHALAKIGNIYANLVGGVESDLPKVTVNWVAIEVLNLDENDKIINYPTEGYFNLVTGKWAAKSRNEDPALLLYALGIDNLDNNDNKGIHYLKYHYGSNESGATFTPDKNQENEITGIEAKAVFNEMKMAIESERYNPISEEYDVTYTAIELSAEDKKLTKDEASPLYLIPVDGAKTKLKVIVNYTMPVKPSSNSETHITQSADISFPNGFKMNTAYNLHIHIGVQDIKVDASVTNWEEASPEVENVYVEPTNDPKRGSSTNND